jgi:hypothetical protein
MNGVIFFLSIGPVLIALSTTLRHDRAWRTVARYTLTTGIALLMLFAAIVMLVRPPDAPLHLWLGVVQRVALLLWLAGLIALAVRLGRVTRANAPPQQTAF